MATVTPCEGDHMSKFLVELDGSLESGADEVQQLNDIVEKEEFLTEDMLNHRLEYEGYIYQKKKLIHYLEGFARKLHNVIISYMESVSQPTTQSQSDP